MKKEYDLHKERLKLIFISATFGTIGIVTHFIPLISAAIVFYRALLGGLFIIFMTYMSGKIVNIKAMHDNFLVLVCTVFLWGLTGFFSLKHLEFQLLQLEQCATILCLYFYLL